jgi:hypothetical protein
VLAMLLVVAFVAVGAWLTGSLSSRDPVIGDIERMQFLPDTRLPGPDPSCSSTRAGQQLEEKLLARDRTATPAQ